ncbi:unnamed protein product [Heterosigma akashiwo]
MVPKGRIFMWPTVEVGRRVEVTHLEDAPNGQPIVVETLSTSPRVFRLHNLFTHEEADAFIENALSITDEVFKLKRSRTFIEHPDSIEHTDSLSISDEANRLKRSSTGPRVHRELAPHQRERVRRGQRRGQGAEAALHGPARLPRVQRHLVRWDADPAVPDGPGLQQAHGPLRQQRPRRRDQRRPQLRLRGQRHQPVRDDPHVPVGRGGGRGDGVPRGPAGGAAPRRAAGAAARGRGGRARPRAGGPVRARLVGGEDGGGVPAPPGRQAQEGRGHPVLQPAPGRAHRRGLVARGVPRAGGHEVGGQPVAVERRAPGVQRHHGGRHGDRHLGPGAQARHLHQPRLGQRAVVLGGQLLLGPGGRPEHCIQYLHRASVESTCGQC